MRPIGDYPDATAVVDVDSIGLVNAVSRLNQGLDVGGQTIGQCDEVSHRRHGQSRGRGSGRRDASIRVEGRSWCGVRDHQTRVRRRSVRADSSPARSRRASRSCSACGRSKVCSMPSIWRTKCPACACRRRCSIACDVHPTHERGRAGRRGDCGRGHARASKQRARRERDPSARAFRSRTGLTRCAGVIASRISPDLRCTCSFSHVNNACRDREGPV